MVSRLDVHIGGGGGMQMFIIHDDNDGNLIILGYCMLDHTNKSFAVVTAAPPVATQELLH